jgi:hypothetical protein
MKTENDVWRRLLERGAAQLSPGFPGRVLRAARSRVEAAPLFMRQFALCAATAALCLAAVAIYHTTSSGDENDRNLAGWEQIASQAADLDQTL